MCYRYHKIGLLVLFVHDVTDILLEFTKCNAYIKKRNGNIYRCNEYLANFGFVAFTASWFLFRLYWFPLKILYASSVLSYRAYRRGAGLYSINFLLWFLLILDIYWFYVIRLLILFFII